MEFLNNKKIIAIIIIIALILAGVVIFRILKQNSKAKITDEESLEIKVLNSTNAPVKNLDVGLWKADSEKENPDIRSMKTNEEGIATFKIPEGDYLIGFNSIGFPKEFKYPEKIHITIKADQNNKTIILESS